MQLTLTITVDYDEATISDKEAESALNYAAQHLASNGLLSSEEGVVDEWSYKVEQK